MTEMNILQELLTLSESYTIDDQIEIDEDEFGVKDRADLLKKLKSKLGNLKLVADFEEDKAQALSELGVKSAYVEDLKKAGFKDEFKATVGEINAKLFWNSQTKVGALFFNDGDFGSWVVKK